MSESEEVDLDCTTFSQFELGISNGDDVFSSSFLNTSSGKDEDGVTTTGEGWTLDVTTTREDSSFHMSRVASFFNEIVGLQNDDNFCLSESTWVRELEGVENLEKTMANGDGCPQSDSKDLNQTLQPKKHVKGPKGSKRKISQPFSELVEGMGKKGDFKSGTKDKISPVCTSNETKSTQNSEKILLECVLNEQKCKMDVKRRKVKVGRKKVQSSFICLLCSKTVSTKRKLNEHKRMHIKKFMKSRRLQLWRMAI